VPGGTFNNFVFQTAWNGWRVPGFHSFVCGTSGVVARFPRDNAVVRGFPGMNFQQADADPITGHSLVLVYQTFGV